MVCRLVCVCVVSPWCAQASLPYPARVHSACTASTVWSVWPVKYGRLICRPVTDRAADMELYVVRSLFIAPTHLALVLDLYSVWSAVYVYAVNLLSLDGCPSTYFFIPRRWPKHLFYSPTVGPRFCLIKARSCKLSAHGPLSMHGPCSPLWHLLALGGWQQQQPTCAPAACAFKSAFKWPSSAARTPNRAPSISACAP